MCPLSLGRTSELLKGVGDTLRVFVGMTETPRSPPPLGSQSDRPATGWHTTAVQGAPPPRPQAEAPAARSRFWLSRTPSFTATDFRGRHRPPTLCGKPSIAPSALADGPLHQRRQGVGRPGGEAGLPRCMHRIAVSGWVVAEGPPRTSGRPRPCCGSTQTGREWTAPQAMGLSRCRRGRP